MKFSAWAVSAYIAGSRVDHVWKMNSSKIHLVSTLFRLCKHRHSWRSIREQADEVAGELFISVSFSGQAKWASLVKTYTSAPVTMMVMETYFALWIRRGNVAASVNTFPTLGVRLSTQMSHEWRSVVVSFVIKDGLSCGRRVQRPTVLFAVIIWICHGVSFERDSTIGQCGCLFKARTPFWPSFSSKAIADPQSVSLVKSFLFSVHCS